MNSPHAHRSTAPRPPVGAPRRTRRDRQPTYNDLLRDNQTLRRQVRDLKAWRALFALIFAIIALMVGCAAVSSCATREDLAFAVHRRAIEEAKLPLETRVGWR